MSFFSFPVAAPGLPSAPMTRMSALVICGCPRNSPSVPSTSSRVPECRTLPSHAWPKMGMGMVRTPSVTMIRNGWRGLPLGVSCDWSPESGRTTPTTSTTAVIDSPTCA